MNPKFLLTTILVVAVLSADVPDNYTKSGSINLLANTLDLGYSPDQSILVVLTSEAQNFFSTYNGINYQQYKNITI